MFKLLEYYGRWQGLKGNVQQLPLWARFMLVVAAIPGVVLICLSILAFLVSLLALLLLTIPTLRVIQIIARLTGAKGRQTVQRAGTGGFGPVPDGMEEVVASGDVVIDAPTAAEPQRARRQIEVK